MIESLVYLLLAIGNSLFDAFVFMFGWNTVIHKIGFPEISYIVSYGICDNMLWHDNITDDSSYSPILMEYMQAAMIVGMATKDEIMAERNTVHKLETNELVEDVN